MSTKIKIKIKSYDYTVLLKKVYLKMSEGYMLKRKYTAWFGFGKYVAVMTKEIPNG